MQNDDFERQLALIEGENINVTESNPIKDLLEVAIKIIIILSFVYFLIYFTSGIIIKNLSIKEQTAIENLIAKVVSKNERFIIEKDKVSIEKLSKIKSKILKYDIYFPKTAKLDIKIIKDNSLNAFCLPDGSIYITSSLLKRIEDDEEMLSFILAHEMAHYKNKDHIMMLRKGLASSIILILVSFTENSDSLYTIIENSMDFSDLNHSRSAETKADNYASKFLMKEYGNTQGGIKVLKILSEEDNSKLDLLSTHPAINKRIKNLEKMETKTSK